MDQWRKRVSLEDVLWRLVVQEGDIQAKCSQAHRRGVDVATGNPL
jgi:hypothetical protein